MSWRIRDLADKAFEASLETTTGAVRRELRAIFADEEVKVSKGKTFLIKIAPVDIPKNYLTFMGGYARHPLGNALALVDEYPKRIDQARKVRQAAFHAWGDGTVEKGDVIGVTVLTFMGTMRRIM